MNQRRNQRLPWVLSAELTVQSGESHFTETRDVSLTGAWLEYLPRAAELGTGCYLTLFIEDDAGQAAVTFRGRIAFTDGDGCGVQFLTVDDDDFKVFARALMAQAPDPEALRGEIEGGFVPAVEEWDKV